MERTETGTIKQQELRARLESLGEQPPPFDFVGFYRSEIDALASLVPFIVPKKPLTDDEFGFESMQKCVKNVGNELSELFARKNFANLCNFVHVRNSDYVIVDTLSYVFQMFFTGSEYIVVISVSLLLFFFIVGTIDYLVHSKIVSRVKSMHCEYYLPLSETQPKKKNKTKKFFVHEK